MELSDVNYNYGLVEVGEEKTVRVLQENLQRQSNTNSLNKQLFQERTDYFTATEVTSPEEKFSARMIPFRNPLKKHWH